MQFSVEPIGFVKSVRQSPEDDFWGDEQACIALEPSYPPESLRGLSEFSHAEVLFLFHEVDPRRVVGGARHPRNNEIWPEVGIFSQRGKNRPNRLGSTICKVVRIEETRLYVSGLDAINDTPVIDIKPVMIEFLPREAVSQPTWATELMSKYWRQRTTDT
jgi:tRNA-Thr(GGU) m(6)t(6)A37 methyltransferase TsaA